MRRVHLIDAARPGTRRAQNAERFSASKSGSGSGVSMASVDAKRIGVRRKACCEPGDRALGQRGVRVFVQSRRACFGWIDAQNIERLARLSRCESRATDGRSANRGQTGSSARARRRNRRADSANWRPNASTRGRQRSAAACRRRFVSEQIASEWRIECIARIERRKQVVGRRSEVAAGSARNQAARKSRRSIRRNHAMHAGNA